MPAPMEIPNMIPHVVAIGLSEMRLVENINPPNSNYDCAAIITDTLASVRTHGKGLGEHFEGIFTALEAHAKLNAGFERANEVTLIGCEQAPGGRLLFATTGPLLGDFDDVRAYKAVGELVGKKLKSIGAKAPLLAVVPSNRFPNAQLLALLGVLHSQYVPLNVREASVSPPYTKKLGFPHLGWLHLYPNHDTTTQFSGVNAPLGYLTSGREFREVAEAIDVAFTVARDIGDGDPQRMAPAKVADYVRKLFGEAKIVETTVIDDQKEIDSEFPLMAAVNRGANVVEAHRAQLIRLEYNGGSAGDGSDIAETLLMVGKGVTIDTGGVDVKVRGAMFGMSLDKYGAAVVASFFAALQCLRPKGVKVVGYMPMVRNSVGADSYTCDEIITSRSKKRIHIVNTDAEGRLIMLDPLTRLVEDCHKERNPHLFTIATLTGHELISYGHCAAVMDNGPARAQHYADSLQEIGELFGQPMEQSRLYKEDLDFNSSQSPAADLRQGVNKPSVETIRGHQSPAAFLLRGSRLDEHGMESAHPLKYSHIDMANIMLNHPHYAFPNPLLALIARHVLPRMEQPPVQHVFSTEAKK